MHVLDSCCGASCCGACGAQHKEHNTSTCSPALLPPFGKSNSVYCVCQVTAYLTRHNTHRTAQDKARMQAMLQSREPAVQTGVQQIWGGFSTRFHQCACRTLRLCACAAASPESNARQPSVPSPADAAASTWPDTVLLSTTCTGVLCGVNNRYSS
jgi:hypothetical protein